MQEIIKSFNEDFLTHNRCTVQKVMSSAHFLCLHCRFPGRTVYFYIGRGAQFQGVSFVDEPIPAHLRVKDRYLEYARKYWRSMIIKTMKVNEHDRVLSISGDSIHGENKIYFFWRGRDLFFAHAFIKGMEGKLYRSWERSLAIDREGYDEISSKMLFKDLGYGENVRNKGDLNVVDYLKNQSAKKGEKAFLNKIEKKKKSLEVKLAKELELIDKALETTASLNDDLTTTSVLGEGRFSIKLYHLEGHYKKRDHLFTKIKKWKESKKIIESRIKSINAEVKKKKASTQVLKIPSVKIISPIWTTSKPASEIEFNPNYISFMYKEFKCYVGRSALENDYIRTKISKKTDVWVHLENMKSGHLFIRGGKPAIQDFTVLTSALVELCAMSLLEMPIIFTEVANLKGLKGTRGSVTFKKEKRLTLYFDQSWREQVLAIDEISDL
jgi:hypothetical protein